MSELPNELRELFAESRRAHEPDSARLLAVRSRLDLSVGANAEFDLAPPRVRVGRWWLWSGVGLMVVVGGLLWTASSAPTLPVTPAVPAVQGVEARVEPVLEAPAVTGVESVPAITPTLEKPRASRVVRRREVASTPRAPSAAAAISLESEPDALLAPETAATSALPIDREDGETSTKSQAVSIRPRTGEAARSLQAEVKLISRAREALADGDWKDAERTLAQHRSEYPAGQLHAERVALMTRARCMASDLEGARRLLEELTLLGAGSSLVRNVERTCTQLGH